MNDFSQCYLSNLLFAKIVMMMNFCSSGKKSIEPAKIKLLSSFKIITDSILMLSPSYHFHQSNDLGHECLKKNKTKLKSSLDRRK